MKEFKATVYGAGINDADYATRVRETIEVNGVRKQKLVWYCPYYRAWKSMIQRCYSTRYQERKPTYKGCSVTEEWLTFSNFKKWMEGQDWEDKQLDKDILFEGNKIYSAETCAFVTKAVNNFTTDRGNDRGEWLIGVSWNKEKSKFTSQCSNPFTKKYEYLGCFTCEEEAHQSWLKRKLELAHLLAAKQTDERVGKALVERYTNFGEYKWL